jgi:hypothetical protein
MGLLPAAVPDVPESRSEIVPARLARKLAPLFGIPWEGGPFGGRTWVCDYNRLTLTEIARGAPLPTRGRLRKAQDAVSGAWQVVDRAVVAGPKVQLPNEIPNPTLNRFGPDTKAAVVLTGANVLLQPVTRAIEEALPLVTAADGSELPARLRVAVWAAMVLEAFRSQPALAFAAIRARAIQRELLVEWELPLAAATDLPLTRCEVGAPGSRPRAEGSQPQELDLADRTAELLEVSSADELVDRLLRQLMAIGTRKSSSHLWLSERRPGQLVVEALVSPTELVDRFGRLVAPLLDAHDADEPVLPRVPDATELAGLSQLTRRAVVLGLLTVLRQVQFRGELRERTRNQIVPSLDAVAALATESLGPADPAGALFACRAADMTVHTLRHDVRYELGNALEGLMDRVERCIMLCELGVLDRGAAAEAVSSANVEVNVVRRTNARHADAKLPSPEGLDRWLRGSWAAFIRALEIDPDQEPGADPDPRRPAGHHLHNYASYLATHVDDTADLRGAVELFENVVIPARKRYRDLTRSALPLRQSFQTASRATTALSRRAAGAGDLGEAREWAAKGLEWIRGALDEHETTELLAGATEPAAHFCLLAVPALLTAVEVDVEGAGREEITRAAELLAIAQRWVDRVTGGDPASYSRHDEIVELRNRLAVLAPPRG